MLCVPIGSWTIVGPKCMCGSTNPGAITWPGASLTVFTSAGGPSRTCFSDPTATMCPDGLTGDCLRDGVLRVDGEDRSDVHGRYVRVVLPRTAAPDCDGEKRCGRGFPPPEEVPTRHRLHPSDPPVRADSNAQSKRAAPIHSSPCRTHCNRSPTNPSSTPRRWTTPSTSRSPPNRTTSGQEFTRQNTLDWCRAPKKVTYTSPEPYDEDDAHRRPRRRSDNAQRAVLHLGRRPAKHVYRHAFYAKISLASRTQAVRRVHRGDAFARWPQPHRGSSPCGPVASHCRRFSRRRSPRPRSAASNATRSSTSADLTGPRLSPHVHQPPPRDAGSSHSCPYMSKPSGEPDGRYR